MSISRASVLILTALLLAACNKPAPQSTTTAEANAPKPVAEQEKEIAARLAEQKAALDAQSANQSSEADRQRVNQQIKDLAGRLDALRAEANKTGRSELGPVIEKLKTLRSDADRIEVTDCTRKVRETLTASMDKTIATLTAFAAATGEPDAAAKKGAEEAQTLMMEADRQMTACL
jgi:hypothetical protein